MGAEISNLDDILAEDMHFWYKKFMKESPSGLITVFELKSMLSLTGITEEASSYVDQVFYTFDMDGDGYIDFVEYIALLSLMLRGEINQKLKWYFKLFDQDGNGKIDKEEMETIFRAIQDISRIYDVPPQEIVSLIYDKIDVKGEGELTLEEFITGAREHPEIMEMLTKMMDLTNVLVIILEGRRSVPQARSRGNAAGNMQSAETKLSGSSLLTALRRYSAVVRDMEETVLLPSLLREVPADEDNSRDQGSAGRDLHEYYIMLKALRNTVESSLMSLNEHHRQPAHGKTLEPLQESDPQALFHFHLNGILSLMNSLTNKAQRITAKYLQMVGVAN
ncbi:hypothetical protein GJAV_G00057510 [Gymnothorax javanicus]|nr:hypothetical protein GJAV_G00057510 [Gymnothorax javanicus]